VFAAAGLDEPVGGVVDVVVAFLAAIRDYVNRRCAASSNPPVPQVITKAGGCDRWVGSSSPSRMGSSPVDLAAGERGVASAIASHCD